MPEIVAAINASAAIATKFEIGFLKKVPIKMIDDPANPGIMIPEFATAKEHLRAWIIGEARRASNFGHQMIKAETADVINKGDIV